MQIEGYEFPEDLYYTPEHFWARVEDSLVVQGATDFTQKMAGEIVYVELPKKGRKVEQGKPFASIQSGKWVGRIHAAVSGDIVEINEELEDEPTLINSDPYGAGWIVKIGPSDNAELGGLMRAGTPEFQRWFTGEVSKHKKA